MTRHDADQVIARITRDGYYDRRWKIRHAPPEPIEPEGWRFFLEVAVGTVVLGGLFVGLWAWVGIAGAVQP